MDPSMFISTQRIVIPQGLVLKTCNIKLNLIVFLIRCEQSLSELGRNCHLAEKNWLGRKLSYNSQDKTLTVDNNMVFDFNLALGDSSIFYATGNVNYFLIHTSRSEENILGITDSVYGYSVLSYDNSNNLIPSQFSSTPIQIAKTLGAIRFIDIAQFPNAAIEYEITGQDHENIGHIGSYGLTYDDVYPWDIGDTLQCSGSNPTSEGGISSIITYTVTNRIESSDSVFIHLNKRIFSTVYQEDLLLMIPLVLLSTFCTTMY